MYDGVLGIKTLGRRIEGVDVNLLDYGHRVIGITISFQCIFWLLCSCNPFPTVFRAVVSSNVRQLSRRRRRFALASFLFLPKSALATSCALACSLTPTPTPPMTTTTCQEVNSNHDLLRCCLVIRTSRMLRTSVVSVHGSSFETFTQPVSAPHVHVHMLKVHQKHSEAVYCHL